MFISNHNQRLKAFGVSQAKTILHLSYQNLKEKIKAILVK